MLETLHTRYTIKLKNGETLVINTDNSQHESVFRQSNNENQFYCLPKTVINKDQVAYIEVDSTYL